MPLEQTMTLYSDQLTSSEKARRQLRTAVVGGAQHFLDVYRERVLRRIRNLIIHATVASGLGLAAAVWLDHTVLVGVFTGMILAVPGWVLPLYFQARRTPEVNVDVEVGIRPTVPVDVVRH